MEVNKIISHALQSMPPSKRQKAFAKDTSKLIHMGLNENNYGMSPKAVAALEDSMAGSHFYPDFAAVLLILDTDIADDVLYVDEPTRFELATAMEREQVVVPRKTNHRHEFVAEQAHERIGQTDVVETEQKALVVGSNLQ